MTLNFAPFPLIETERLLLRKVEMRDADEIYFLRSDKRVLEYLDRGPAGSLEEAVTFIEKLKELEKDGEAVTWAITLKGDDRLIGTICYWHIQKEHFRAEIGYVLNPDYQRKGIMQEAFNHVLPYGFKVMKLHSIEANVNPNNNASIKLLERNKFRREGYFKENYYFKDQFLDSAIYSLLERWY